MLRKYQVEPVSKGIEFFKSKNPPSIICMPVAAGKSHVIAEIAAGIEGNVLVVQPSIELLHQNYSKFLATGNEASIYSAGAGVKEVGKTTFATIGSIHKHGHLFQGYKLIVDEIHLYPRGEGMFRSFINAAGIEHVLGLSASPLKLQTNTDASGNHFSKLSMLTSRSKKGNFFKEMIHVTQIQEMKEYWSPLVYEQHIVDNSSLAFNSTKSDFTDESMRLAYNSNHLSERIVKRISELDRKSILVFVSSVAEAQSLADKIPNAVAVYGDMDKKLREAYVESFKLGHIRVIVNVNVLGVGFDHPQLDCIIEGRPTSSLAVYYQHLGRGCRIHPDKKDCLICDYSGNVAKFGTLEKLEFKKENIWKLYGEKGLLSGIPLHEIGKTFVMPFGKHSGKEVKDIPKDYLDWMIREFKWDSKNNYIKQEILRHQTI